MRTPHEVVAEVLQENWDFSRLPPGSSSWGNATADAVLAALDAEGYVICMEDTTWKPGPRYVPVERPS